MFHAKHCRFDSRELGSDMVASNGARKPDS